MDVTLMIVDEQIAASVGVPLGESSETNLSAGEKK